MGFYLYMGLCMEVGSIIVIRGIILIRYQHSYKTHLDILYYTIKNQLATYSLFIV